MSRSFKTIKGTFDILPDDATSDGSAIAGSPTWQYVEQTIHRVMQRFNAAEIRTPILEPTALIARGIGQLTDIVSKEMFAFERGDTHYVLRPEVTAPVMRAYLQHRLDQKGGVQKLYYIGPCFRAERPQKGRYRQFHQFGLEVIGSEDPRADAEVIMAMVAVYEALGIERMRLRINTLGDAASRPRFKAALQAYLEPYRQELSATSQERLAQNPLRILDTKNPHEQQLIEDAPRLIDFVSTESRAQYEVVKALLADQGLAFEEDHKLVRGLDYYSHTAFELEGEDLGAQSALAGGGRYDLLAQEIGSKRPVPAVGFAAGMERLLIALAAQGVSLPSAPKPLAFIVALGDDAMRWAFGQAQHWRRGGLPVALDLKGRSLKAQMREANRQDAAYTVIVGKDELAQAAANVKDMAANTQERVPFDRLMAYLEARSPARSSP